MENNIIIIEKNFNNEIKETVNARELWIKLGSKREFANWIKDRVSRFIENIDFIKIDNFVNVENSNLKRKQIDYFLTIDCAKMICMLENNQKGDEIRKYFIECEKKLHQQQTKLPLIDSKFLLQISQKMAELENKIEEDKPKVEFYDTVLKSKDFVEMSEVAKCLNKNIGRNKLFNILKENGILRWNNEPYQKFVDNGYFKIETNYYTTNNQTKIYFKTVVSQKGIDFINKLLSYKNINNIIKKIDK